MTKNAQKTILKKFIDDRSLSFNVTLPCILTNNKKKPVINFRNPEGWENYNKVSDAHAQSIRDAIDNINDINELGIKIHIINIEIQVESFGVTWEGKKKQQEKYISSSRRSSMSSLLKGQAQKMSTTKYTG